MRTKTLKINGKEIEAVLMAGGKGFKIYSFPEGLIVDKGRVKVVLEEKSPSYKTVIDYVNLRYHNLDKQKEITEKFQDYIHSITSSNPNLKSFTTKKLKEILDEPYLRGTTGIDYEGEYSREELEQEYLSRLGKIDAKKLKEIDLQAEKYKPQVAQKISIKISWRFYESLKESYAYLELPDHPFYNVRIYTNKKSFDVVASDGYRAISEKSFKKLDDAFIYAEEEFLKLSKKDTDYKVKIV